jgi:flagellar protein FlaG
MSIQFNTAPSATAPVPKPASQAMPARAVDTEAIKQAATAVNDILKTLASVIEFTVDTRSEKIVVHIVDSQTGKVIRQIPTEDMLALSRSIDQMASLLMKSKA